MTSAGQSSAHERRFRSDAGAPLVPRVRHHCPGGREDGGGIGRLVGYVADTAAAGGAHHLVQDTRGRRWFPPTSLPRLGAASAAIAWDRLAAPDRLQHIHVAGRGSTLRKVALCGTARLLGSRYVLHLHDYDYAADFAARPASVQRRIRRMFQGADQVIVLGQRDRDLALGPLGVKPDRLNVLPNCVPDPGPGGLKRSSPPLILFLGRLSERKGVPELLSALAQPVLAGLAWQAVLAGDGPLDEFRRDAAALDLSGRVEMPGWVGEAEVSALCRRADILVLPSRAEGLAMAVLEGLAHGTAVVTTRVGAHDEVITHDHDGLFVPVGDAVALADALAALLVDPDRRSRLASAGRRTFLERFSMGPYMSRLAPIYEAAVRQERGLPSLSDGGHA